MVRVERVQWVLVERVQCGGRASEVWWKGERSVVDIDLLLG